MKHARILFLRHGESEYSQSGRYTGRTDVPLTLQGKTQATLSGKWLNQFTSPDIVLSSPKIRTTQTAKLAVTELQKFEGEIQYDERLREIFYGTWEGKTRDEILEEDGDNYNAWELDPVTYPAGTIGETAQEVYERVQQTVVEVLSNCPENATILLVTHRTVMRTMMAGLLGVPLNQYRQRFEQAHASINGFACSLKGCNVEAQLLYANIAPWLETLGPDKSFR